MTRTLGAALKPAGHRFVYDKDPEEITRPDTIPAALRFAEASALSSGVAHAQPRELKPYPRLPSLPDVTAANDDATVVDPPFQPPRKELPSGPRHRTPATASTVPPPSRARQKVPRVERAVPQSVEPLIVEQPRAITTSPPALHTPPPHTRKRWPFALALLGTAVASAVFGTALGNGSFERAVQPPHTATETRQAPPNATLPQTREAPRAVAVAPTARPTSPPGVAGAPITSLGGDPPVIRVEDLPLAEEGTGTRVTRSGRPIRTKAARR